jgi:hypothetical protein
MSAVDEWVSTDSRARFTVLRGNLWKDLSLDGGWHNVIAKLDAWSSDPGAVGDDDVEPPTHQALRFTTSLIQSWADETPAPTRIMPNRDGGIVLEWIQGDRTTVCEIHPTLVVETSWFQAGVRKHREVLDLSSAMPT